MNLNIIMSTIDLFYKKYLNLFMESHNPKKNCVCVCLSLKVYINHSLNNVNICERNHHFMV